LISFFYSLKDTNSDERASGNIAFDAISFGQFAVLSVIISIYRIFTEKQSKTLIKIGYLLAACLGMYVALKSGSRGPLLALFGVLFLWYSFKIKKIFNIYLYFCVLILIVFLFSGFILKLLVYISPVAAFRINEGINGDDLSVIARQESYAWFFTAILENPIFGSQFARLRNGEFKV
jgi:O-antigen ligase